MNKYRDSCNSRRAASDLLSWSMGREARNGFNYDPPGYQTPANPAKPPRPLRQRAEDARGWTSALGVNALRRVLLWWLSFDEKRDQRKSR